MHKSWVGSHVGSGLAGEGEDGTGENNTGEAGLAATLKARRLRGKPPHTLLSGGGEKFPNKLTVGLNEKPPHVLLARFEAGDASDGKIIAWAGWETSVLACKSSP